MQLPSRSSDDVVVLSREDVPARRHGSICAANLSGSIVEHLSTTLAASTLPHCCTTVPQVAPIATLMPGRCCDDGAAMRTVLRGGLHGHPSDISAAATFVRAAALPPP